MISTSWRSFWRRRQRSDDRSMTAKSSEILSVPRRRRRSGFTLIELMIVLSIIGILSAVAIPTLARLQLRASTAEAGSNLSAIRRAQGAWYAEQGSYLAAAPSPATNGGAKRQPFVDVGGDFGVLGWSPEGTVFFNYAVTSAGGAYTADASADLDDDGTPQVWGFVHPDLLGATIVGALSCAGVWDAASSSPAILDVVGPCGANHGRGVL